MGEESPIHLTQSKAPHPSPLPAGEGDRSSPRRKAPALIPLTHPGSLFPLPAGEGQGEGPLQNDNVWVFLFG